MNDTNGSECTSISIWMEDITSGVAWHAWLIKIDSAASAILWFVDTRTRGEVWVKIFYASQFLFWIRSLIRQVYFSKNPCLRKMTWNHDLYTRIASTTGIFSRGWFPIIIFSKYSLWYQHVIWSKVVTASWDMLFFPSGTIHTQVNEIYT